MPDTLKPSSKVVLVRPDGTTLQATPEQAEKLKVLGYSEETPYAGYERAREAGREEHYTSGGQQLKAGVEGLGRGLSLGLTDYAFGDDDTRARAEYNPGTAIATEIAGAILPAVFTAGATAPVTAASTAKAGGGVLRALAGATPSGLLTRGAAAATAGIKRPVARMAGAGAIEGAVAGGATTINHAYLSGDPLTAEAVVAGIGWGTLFGAGAGAIAGKVTSRAAAKAEAQSVAEKAARILDDGAPAYSGFVREIDGFKSEIAKAASRVDSALESEIAKLSNAVGKSFADDVSGPMVKELRNSLRAVHKAQKAGDAEALETAYTRLSAAHKAATDPSNYAGAAVASQVKVPDVVAPLKELGYMRAVLRSFDEFPTSIHSFARMSDAKAEKLFAALGKAKGLKEFPTLSASADEAAKSLSMAFGVDGAGLAELRKTWAAAKAASKKGEPAKAKPGLIARGLGMAAGAAMAAKGGIGGGRLGAAAAYVTTKEAVVRALTPGGLFAARNGVLSRLSSAASNFTTRTAQKTAKIGKRIQPLAVSIEGRIDQSRKSEEELVALRIDEFARAAQGVNDALYAAVESISGEQPLLAPAMHKAAVERFNKFRAMLPADPGVVSGLKSVWKPSPIQAAVFARQYEVFVDPVGVAERMLQTGDFDPVAVKTLKTIDPALFQHVRDVLLEHVTRGKYLEGMPIEEQMALGVMLDIPIHSSMRPEFIATSLQRHTKRNEAMPTPTAPGAGDKGGRPGADSPNATMSQRITER